MSSQSDIHSSSSSTRTFPSLTELDTNLPSATSVNTPPSSMTSPVLTRKSRVSSLSLSDIHIQLQRARSGSRPRSRSRSASRMKKSIIDHPRVASYAFAFDIDGVIVRGPETIPEAIQAVNLLNGDNRYKIKIPFIFVTNGGGRSELKRCQDLSKRLNTDIKRDQIIQGHTPMKDLVDTHKTVLVIGGVGNDCRKVAQEYGFEDVVTPLDIMRWKPSVTPYHTLTKEEYECTEERDFDKTNIEAILVFADSRNWATDQQIILELLMSKHGRMGTVSPSFNEGPQLYFAHSDFVWATNYNLTRYGMGALQISLGALFKAHTGKELKMIRFGKPQKDTFKYTTKVLSKWRTEALQKHVDEGNHDSPLEETEYDSDELVVDDDSDDYDEEPLSLHFSAHALTLPPASTVYFVGDTPESDIRFANSHDESWYSILVKTGVYQDGAIPSYKPKHICDNVLEAVKFAIEREHAKELAEWNEHSVRDQVPAGLTMSSIN